MGERQRGDRRRLGMIQPAFAFAFAAQAHSSTTAAVQLTLISLVCSMARLAMMRRVPPLRGAPVRGVAHLQVQVELCGALVQLLLDLAGHLLTLRQQLLSIEVSLHSGSAARGCARMWAGRDSEQVKTNAAAEASA